MGWRNDTRYRGGGYWVCRVRNRERSRVYYQLHSEHMRAKADARRRRLVEQGLCSDCGNPRLSEHRCWDCLNRNARSTWQEPTTTPGETPNTRLVQLSESK